MHSRDKVEPRGSISAVIIICSDGEIYCKRNHETIDRQLVTISHISGQRNSQEEIPSQAATNVCVIRTSILTCLIILELVVQRAACRRVPIYIQCMTIIGLESRIRSVLSTEESDMESLDLSVSIGV